MAWIITYSTIFFNSAIFRRLEAGEFGNGLIVGDGGYAVKNVLITPLLNPVSRAEHLFQESQIRTRNVVERSYGVWKRRFPVLSLGIRLDISKVEAIIIATAVLHNIAILQKENIPPTTQEIQEQINLVNSVNFNVINENIDNHTNDKTRLTIIQNHFGGMC